MKNKIKSSFLKSPLYSTKFESYFNIYENFTSIHGVDFPEYVK